MFKVISYLIRYYFFSLEVINSLGMVCLVFLGVRWESWLGKKGERIYIVFDLNFYGISKFLLFRISYVICNC